MNSEINYNIIRRKVKNIRISVNKDKEVKVIIPMRYPVSELNKVLENRKGWIKKKLEHFDNLKNNFFSLLENEILYLDKKYTFVLKPEMKNYFQIDEERMKIYSGVDLLNKRLQEHWLKQEAKRVIEERVELINKDGRFKYKKIFIRSQRTKWGNCSGRKNVSFNWRLIKAPLDVIDYLIVHEFTHLEERNHSKVFWNKVSQLYPNYKESNRWLKKNGVGLFF
jgi:predicted metal-dependent hydrolase